MRRIAVLDAPSNLGLRPPTATSVPGVYKAPGALRDQGLITRLHARDAGCLTPPRYDPGEWRPGDGVAQSEQIAAYSRRLADRIAGIIDAGEFPVILGGDCSIVIGSGLAMHRLGESVGGRIGLVFVDGHSDFRHPGNASYVGAAAGEDLALVTGRGQPDLAAIEQRRPYFRDVDVVVMGIRAQDEYRLDLQAAGIVTRPVPTLRVEGAARSAQWAREQLVDCAGFWVHVDMDVLDPAVMPCVDAPEPGGIAFPELELLLAGLVDTPHCLGVEITVFDPDYDPDGAYAADITTSLVAGLAPARTVPARPDLIAARRALSNPEPVAPAALLRSPADAFPAEFAAGGLEAAGPEAAGPEAAGSEAAGSEAAGSEAAGSEAAGFEAAGFEASPSPAAELTVGDDPDLAVAESASDEAAADGLRGDPDEPAVHGLRRDSDEPASPGLRRDSDEPASPGLRRDPDEAAEESRGDDGATVADGSRGHADEPAAGGLSGYSDEAAVDGLRGDAESGGDGESGGDAEEAAADKSRGYAHQAAAVLAEPDDFFGRPRPRVGGLARRPDVISSADGSTASNPARSEAVASDSAAFDPAESASAASDAQASDAQASDVAASDPDWPNQPGRLGRRPGGLAERADLLASADWPARLGARPGVLGPRADAARPGGLRRAGLTLGADSEAESVQERRAAAAADSVTLAAAGASGADEFGGETSEETALPATTLLGVEESAETPEFANEEADPEPPVDLEPPADSDLADPDLADPDLADPDLADPDLADREWAADLELPADAEFTAETDESDLSDSDNEAAVLTGALAEEHGGEVQHAQENGGEVQHAQENGGPVIPAQSSRPLGSSPRLDSEPLPATRPGRLRPRDLDTFSLPAQRPAFDSDADDSADIDIA